MDRSLNSSSSFKGEWVCRDHVPSHPGLQLLTLEATSVSRFMFFLPDDETAMVKCMVSTLKQIGFRFELHGL